MPVVALGRHFDERRVLYTTRRKVKLRERDVWTVFPCAAKIFIREITPNPSEVALVDSVGTGAVSRGQNEEAAAALKFHVEEQLAAFVRVIFPAFPSPSLFSEALFFTVAIAFVVARSRCRSIHAPDASVLLMLPRTGL